MYFLGDHRARQFCQDIEADPMALKQLINPGRVEDK